MKKTPIRFLIFTIFTALLLSLFVFANGAKYVIDAQSGYTGENVTVDIYLENNPGFGGIGYEVIYDNEILNVVDYQKKLGEQIGVDSGDRLEDRIVFQYAGIRNIAGDEPLVTFTFKIDDDTTARKANISVISLEDTNFYYGGEDKHTEIMFDIESAEGYIEILTKNDKETVEDKPPVDDEPVDDEPVDDEPVDDEPVDDEPVDDSQTDDNKEEWANPFSDVTESDWYFEAVKNANIKGIINGVTPTEFAPNQNITRAMFVTMLFRLEVLPRVRMHNFSDVPLGAWYYNPVAWASEEGIVNGITPTEFAPDVGVTREQLATMLFRYAVYKGLDAITLEENLEGFEDSHDISEYAVTALNWAVGQGLINGTTPTTLSPLSTATRAQVAVILDRFLQMTN